MHGCYPLEGMARNEERFCTCKAAGWVDSAAVMSRRLCVAAHLWKQCSTVCGALGRYDGGCECFSSLQVYLQCCTMLYCTIPAVHLPRLAYQSLSKFPDAWCNMQATRSCPTCTGCASRHTVAAVGKAHLLDVVYYAVAQTV